MAIRIVPVFDGFNLTHLEVKIDREGARRLGRLIMAEGQREYALRTSGKVLKHKSGWRARLGARAVGWANRATGAVTLPYETTIKVDDIDESTLADGQLLRDVILAYTIPLVHNHTDITITREQAVLGISDYLTQIFSGEGDPHIKTRAIKSNAFDKDTQAFLSMQLSTEDAETLARYIVGDV